MSKIKCEKTLELNKVYQGNSLDVLKTFPDESVNMCITSPPYWGLRDYGTAGWEGGNFDCNHKVGRFTTSHSEKQGSNAGSGDIQAKSICPKCGAIRKDKQLGLEATPEKYIEKMVEVFREVKRVLKDDGNCWLNLGDSYAMSSIRGAGEVKNYTRGNRSIKDSVKAWENGIDRKFNSVKASGLKPKDLIGIPWRVAFALQADGWYLRQDIIWHKPNPMPESVTDRCTKSHEYIFLLSKSAKYYYDADAIKEDSIDPESLSGRRKKNRQKFDGQPFSETRVGFEKLEGQIYEKRNKRSVWTINTKPYKEAHFAVFPPKIPELCIKAGSKDGDVVLDPFMGSGTTAEVAMQLDRNWVGIDLNPEYIKISDKRLKPTIIEKKTRDKSKQFWE